VAESAGLGEELEAVVAGRVDEEADAPAGFAGAEDGEEGAAAAQRFVQPPGRTAPHQAARGGSAVAGADGPAGETWPRVSSARAARTTALMAPIFSVESSRP